MDDWQEWKHIIYVVIGGFIARLIYDRFNEQQRVVNSVSRRLQTQAPGDEWREQVDIPEGRAGTIETLKYMREIVHRDSSDPLIRSTAEQIVKACRGHDFLCEVQALFSFVRDRITYRRDPVTTEYVQDSRRTLEAGVGDCDCKVVLLCSLLQSLGHKTRFVVIGHDPEKYAHVYCEVLTRRHGWLPLDPTNEQAPIGWQAQAKVREAYPAYIN